MRQNDSLRKGQHALERYDSRPLSMDFAFTSNARWRC